MNNPVITNIICPNPDCRVGETGKCVEGFAEINKCPHQQKKGVVETTTIKESQNYLEETDEKVDSDNIKLADGSILSIEAATKVLRSGKSFVLTVIGP
jgi:hypothetical protein